MDKSKNSDISRINTKNANKVENLDICIINTIKADKAIKPYISIANIKKVDRANNLDISKIVKDSLKPLTTRKTAV